MLLKLTCEPPVLGSGQVGRWAVVTRQWAVGQVGSRVFPICPSHHLPICLIHHLPISPSAYLPGFFSFAAFAALNATNSSYSAFSDAAWAAAASASSLAFFSRASVPPIGSGLP